MMTLMEIWQAGVRMPFIVEDPNSRQKIIVQSYYWPKKFFECEMNGCLIAITAEWTLWSFVREA